MKLTLHTATVLSLALLAGLALLTPPTARAQINYQGRLTDASGVALPPGPYSLEFRLWSAATGGLLLWGPFQANGGIGTGQGPTVDVVVDGRFNTIIGGSATNGALLRDALANPSAYLEIKVGTSAPVTPRQLILAAPRALRADVIPKITPNATGTPISISDSVGITGNATITGNASISGTSTSNGLVVQRDDTGYPSAQLTIRGSTDPNRRLHIGYHTSNPTVSLQAYVTAAGASTIGLNPEGGNVGVGTRYPGRRLQIGEEGINGPSTPDALIRLAYANGSARTWDFGIGSDTFFGHRDNFGFRDIGGGATIMTLESVGNGGSVGIGTTAPETPLHVRATQAPNPTPVLTLERSNDVQTKWLLSINGNRDLHFRVDGALAGWVSSSGSFVDASDRRLKKDIAGFGPVIEKVMQLQPVSYRLRSTPDSARATYGFIAQDVEPLFPGVVHDGGEHLGISYTALVPIAIGALQELKQEKDTEVTALRAQVTTRDTKIAALEKRLAALEARDQARETRLTRLEATLDAQPARTVRASLEQK